MFNFNFCIIQILIYNMYKNSLQFKIKLKKADQWYLSAVQYSYNIYVIFEFNDKSYIPNQIL